MFIFGGHDIREGSLDNLWMIDLSNLEDLDKESFEQDQSFQWKQIFTQGAVKPDAISHHTSVVHKDKMYMFGGSKASGLENKRFF